MTPRQCLADTNTPMSLRAFLEATFADNKPKPFPEIYATTTRVYAARGAEGTIVMIGAGTRVRVTDVSKFNCVGITNILNEEKRDQARTTLAELTLFSAQP